jgi:hypothetical protein
VIVRVLEERAPQGGDVAYSWMIDLPNHDAIHEPRIGGRPYLSVGPRTVRPTASDQ